MSMPKPNCGAAASQALHLIAAGGDLRQLSAARVLARTFHVTLYGSDAADTDLPTEPQTAADVLLLPMPVTKDGETLFAPLCSRPIPLSSLPALVREGGTVLGGFIPPTLSDTLSAAGCTVGDYAKREDFCVRNAVPTAEGALQIIFEELPRTLHGLRCLILGAGRISQALQPRLSILGASVTVAARRCSDLARTECDERKPSFAVCFLPLSRMIDRFLTKNASDFSPLNTKKYKKRLAFFGEMVYTRMVCKSKDWEVIP